MNSQLTPSSLIASLETIASAKSEQGCAEAIVSAALSIQTAVRAGQDTQSFMEALGSVPNKLSEQMRVVIDRAVNFHPLDGGGYLGLWLLPVTVSARGVAFPVEIDLETESLNYLKMSGCLQQQFGYSGSSSDHRGWAYVVPTLFHGERLRTADIADLVNLPWQARGVVRGTEQGVDFLGGGDAATEVSGIHQYYLPVVVFHPEAAQLVIPQPSSKTLARMAAWFVASMTGKVSLNNYDVKVAQQPSPFSVALEVGDRQLTEVKVRTMIAEVCEKAKMHPNGMAALVAPYAVRQANGDLMLGVTLVSRMTTGVVATMAMPVESDTGEEEVALVSYVLRELGMERIQRQVDPIGTFACQHCGNLQYAMPSVDLAVSSPANHVH